MKVRDAVGGLAVAGWVVAAGLSYAGRCAAKKELSKWRADRVKNREDAVKLGMPSWALTDTLRTAVDEAVGTDRLGNPLVRFETNVMRYDFNKAVWSMPISSYLEISPGHLRSIERALGAPPRSVWLDDVPDSATRKVLVLGVTGCDI